MSGSPNEPSGPVEIPLAELRLALERLLAAVEGRFGSTVPVNADFFWEVNPPAAFDGVEDPKDHVQVGSLADDVETMLRREDPEVYLWHDLAHIAVTINALGWNDLPPPAQWHLEVCADAAPLSTEHRLTLLTGPAAIEVTEQESALDGPG